MQLNYDFDILNTIDLANVENPQILVDNDAIKNTINKVYILPNALDAKVKEMRDELGDEDAPEGKGEADDESDNNESKATQTTAERRMAEAKKSKDGDDEEEEEIQPKPIYLDSKYLYPLGIVKQSIL